MYLKLCNRIDLLHALFVRFCLSNLNLSYSQIFDWLGCFLEINLFSLFFFKLLILLWPFLRIILFTFNKFKISVSFTLNNRFNVIWLILSSLKICLTFWINLKMAFKQILMLFRRRREKYMGLSLWKLMIREVYLLYACPFSHLVTKIIFHHRIVSLNQSNFLQNPLWDSVSLDILLKIG